MEYRRFGPTDLTVSVFGCGVWDYEKTYSGEMETAVNRAFDYGITCFDTAAQYGDGESERMLGRALGSRRKDVVVVTKCGLGFQDSQIGRLKNRDGRRESILQQVDQSLQRMQTDYLDVLLVHAPDVSVPFEETMGALETAVQQGKVRYTGVSNFTEEQVRECEKTRPVSVVQHDYNMFDRRVEKAMYPYCMETGIGVMTYGSMGFGLLTGTFTADMKFQEGDYRGIGGNAGFDGGMLALEHRARNIQVVDELKSVAAKLGKTMPQLALRWVLSNPAVSTALVGTLRTKEFEENMGTLGWALSAEDLREIDGVFAKHGVETHPDIVLDP